MKIHCQVRLPRNSTVLPCAAAGLTVLLAYLPTIAHSADASDAAAKTASSSDLQEIVVTAEKRSTDLQVAAVAASVLTGVDLAARQINTIDNLAFTTPSLTVQSSGENAVINIRGIGKSDAGQQDSSGVLIYRDGVATTPNGLISDEPYYDIDSIEVLRGPQGTFAGQNATGGALFINEANPTLDHFGGWVEAQYGNYEDVRLRGAVNLPLSDTFAIRVATDEENRETFFHVSGPYSGNPGNLHEANARLSALWQPTEDFTALLKLDYNYINHGGSPAAPYTGLAANVFNVASDSYLSGYEKQYRIVLQLSQKFADGITLKSISGYQDGRLSYSLDADGTATPPPLGVSPEYFAAAAKDRTLSQEFDLVSPDTGPFTWVTGAVYQDDDFNNPQFILSLSPGGTLTSGLAISALEYTAQRESWGVFGQVGYQLTSALQLQVGARYSETDFKLTDISQILDFGTPIETSSVLGRKESDSRTTGKANLNYTLNDANFLYAFVATGNKGGGINGDGTIFQPENVTDYELGWKPKFFNGHVRGQLGAFYERYTNFQVSIYVPSVQAGEDANATGTTIVKGIEAQTQAVFGALSFNLGTSYVPTKLGEFSAIDSRNVALGNQNLTGRPLPNAPLWTAQAGVQYAFALPGNQTLTPRVDYGLVGSRWATAFEVPPGDFLAEQNIFNGTLTYDPTNTLKITAYATNFTNDHYVALQLLGNLGMPGPPRQFGIRASKSF